MQTYTDTSKGSVSYFRIEAIDSPKGGVHIMTASDLYNFPMEQYQIPRAVAFTSKTREHDDEVAEMYNDLAEELDEACDTIVHMLQNGYLYTGTLDSDEKAKRSTYLD